MKIVLIVAAVAAVVAILTFVGCRLYGSRETAATVELKARPQGKIAIVYYSQSKVQNTALVAHWIQKHTGGDLIPLELVTPYPDAYGDTLKAVQRDISEDRHPTLKSVPDLSGYDIVFIGAPIWYGTYATPLATFFDAQKLSGKTIAPFCTHGGGGCGRFFVDVKKACPAAKTLEGLTIRGSNQIERRIGTGVTAHSTEDDVVVWLNAIFQ